MARCHRTRVCCWRTQRCTRRLAGRSTCRRPLAIRDFGTAPRLFWTVSGF
ncbi:dispersed gene family protein 1 (DGF-1), putative, partial [Trypanosoma cruzi marinkellei]